MSEPDYDTYDLDHADEGCWKCGGEGFVSSCFEEFACLDPDEGCDLCTRRCDVCSPRPRQASERAALGEILSEALASPPISEKA